MSKRKRPGGVPRGGHSDADWAYQWYRAMYWVERYLPMITDPRALDQVIASSDRHKLEVALASLAAATEQTRLAHETLSRAFAKLPEPAARNVTVVDADPPEGAQA